MILKQNVHNKITAIANETTLQKREFEIFKKKLRLSYNLKAVIKASFGRVRSKTASLAVGSLFTTLLVTTVFANR